MLKAEFNEKPRQPYRLRLLAGAAYGLPDFRDRGYGMDIAKVGVVGAGQMGNGIAHVFALAGYDVLMTDVSKDALDQARQIISGNLDRQVAREKITAAEKDEAMARIATTLVLKDLGQCDMIIEAATERETVKTAIFEDLVPHLKPETILTSNTS